MKNLTASEVFAEGKYQIGYVSPYFKECFYKSFFEEVKSAPTWQTLSRTMSDAEIESTLKPGNCTLGDVLSIIESTDPAYKDGNWNLFYMPTCVVSVYWNAGYGAWNVDAWQRDVDVWDAGGRVFSPATRSVTQISSDTLTLESLDARLKKIEAIINPDLLK